MKRFVFPLIFLAIMMFACNISTTGTPTVAPQPTAQPPGEVTATPPGPTETPTLQTNTTCNELSIYLDLALASDYTCETIAESPEGFETYPQYTKLTLKGYPLTGTFLKPSISVLPVHRYTELLPDSLPGQVATLQDLIGGGVPSDKGLPFLPTLNAA